jgi:hypothetical protein
MANASWKNYGGIHKLNNFNNMSVYSFAADVFTLRQSVYGLFDICGELHVSGNANIDTNIRGNNLVVLNDTSTNRLFVKDISIHYDNVDISGGNLLVQGGNVFLLQNMDVSGHIYLRKELYLGNSFQSYLYGTDTVGNIGINTRTPIAALDISSQYPFAFNVGSKTQPQVYSVPLRNNGNKGFMLSANSTATKIGFYNDTAIASTTTIPDAHIQYSTGGIMTLDSSQNINLFSNVTLSNRDASSHVMGETVVIYDTSAGTYLYPVYQNSSENTGNALSLIANDSSSNTFMNIVTPNRIGLSIGGGVYPNDSTRALGTIGWKDNSANYTPSINIVSGNSHVKQKTTVGINTHAPSTEVCAFEVNGPVRVKNGELTITKQSDFEIKFVTTGRSAPNSGIAVGSPYRYDAATNRYKQKMLYTTDGGENWNENYDSSGDSFEQNSNFLRCSYVYDSSFSIMAGDGGYSYYTYNGYEPTRDRRAWQFISTRDWLFKSYASIRSVFISQQKRVFYGVNLIGGVNSTIYWFDLASNIYDASRGIASYASLYSSGDGSFNLFADRSVKSIDGCGNVIFVACGKSILKCNSTGPTPVITSTYTNSNNYEYNTISVYDTNHIVAAGVNIISYTNNGGTNWTDVLLSGITINRVFVCDASNAIATCNGGIILTSKNGYAAWSPLSTDELNVSGNANRIIDPNYNLTNVAMVNTRNFFITKTIQSYQNSTILGNTSLFHAYLPNVFNNVTNYVFDLSGSARVAGDVNVTDNGRIRSNNTTFYLLNDAVNKIRFGEDASYVYIGNAVDSTVVTNTDLNVIRDISLNRNIMIGGVAQSMYYEGLNNASELNIGGKYNGSSSRIIRIGNYNVPATASNRIYLAGTNDKLAVNGKSTFYNDLEVIEDVSLNRYLSARGAIRSMQYEGYNGTSEINIGGLYEGFAPRTISIGNFGLSNEATNRIRIAGIYDILSVNGKTTFNNDLEVINDISLNRYLSARGAIRSMQYEGYNGTSEINIGGLYNGTIPRTINIGNFNVSNSASNIIKIAGANDTLVVGGKILINNNMELGKNLVFNSVLGQDPEFENASTAAGSGILFADRNQKNRGYFVVSEDLGGYTMRSVGVGNTNRIKLDVSNLIVPATQSTALACIYPTVNYSGGIIEGTRGLVNPPGSFDAPDSDYTVGVCSIDPSNIMIIDKDQSYSFDGESTQTVVTNARFTKNISVGFTYPEGYNLSVGGTSKFYGNTTVQGNFNVLGDVDFAFGNTNIQGTARVTEKLSVGYLQPTECSFAVGGTSNLQGNTIIQGNTFTLQADYAQMNCYMSIGKYAYPDYGYILDVVGNVKLNSRVDIGENLLYSNVYIQRTSENISYSPYTVAYPMYQSYNITNTSNTVITLPLIANGNIQGMTIQFFKTGTANMEVTIQSLGDKFIQNGSTTKLNTFTLVPSKTSTTLLACVGSPNNFWVEVGSGIGTDLSLNGNLSVGGNLSISGGNLTFSSPPSISGSNIQSGTIPITSVSGTAINLSADQTATGLKTFNGGLIVSNQGFSDYTTGLAVSSGIVANSTQTIDFGTNAPTMSGANIVAGTIPIASVSGTAINLSADQTATGLKTFNGGLIVSNQGFSDYTTGLAVSSGITASATQTIDFGDNAPTMSGANIAAGTIPIASVVGNAMALSGSQTASGAKTFTGGLTVSTNPLTVTSGLSVSTTALTVSSGITATSAQTIDFSNNAPIMSGANIAAGTIPTASVVGTAMALSGSQTATGAKTFSGGLTVSTVGLTVSSGGITATSNQTIDFSNNAPIMSGANIKISTIPPSAIVGGVVTNNISNGLNVTGTYLSTGYTANFAGNVVATSYNATSDRRLKTNITPLSSQWDAIKQVKPVAFDWIQDGRSDIGFIAQEIHASYPELRPNHKNIDLTKSTVEDPVDLSGNPIYYTIDYGRMTPFLWQGMREIMQRLEHIEAENTQLKERIRILEDRA